MIDLIILISIGLAGTCIIVGIIGLDNIKKMEAV